MILEDQSESVAFWEYASHDGRNDFDKSTAKDIPVL